MVPSSRFTRERQGCKKQHRKLQHQPQLGRCGIQRFGQVLIEPDTQARVEPAERAGAQPQPLDDQLLANILCNTRYRPQSGLCGRALRPVQYDEDDRVACSGNHLPAIVGGKDHCRADLSAIQRVFDGLHAHYLLCRAEGMGVLERRNKLVAGRGIALIEHHQGQVCDGA